MKRPATIIQDCRTKFTAVKWISKEPQFYESYGKWVGGTVARMQLEAHKRNMEPCIHIEHKSLTKQQYDKLDRINWALEKQELIRNVERGRTPK